jgi:hypothetical protein
MPAKTIYKVVFANEGQIWEIYAREVSQAAMFGFIEVSGLLFGERSSIVVDPTEEKLQSEFAGVECTYIPLHSVVRIDSVKRRGTARILPSSGTGAKVTPLPTAAYPPPGKDKS